MKLFLIDISSMIYRAFYALPHADKAGLRNPAGEPIGAVYGVTRMLMNYAKRIQPGDAVAAVFDAHSKDSNFRNAIDADYKSHRGKANPELAVQFAPCREVAALLGFHVVSVPGYEADDVVASYSESDEIEETEICSPDKDLLCLMRAGIHIFDPLRHNREGAELVPDDVFKKFGVLPRQMPDVLALAGDASDNVAGVPGIGIKTAAALVMRFGSIDSILRQLTLVTPPRIQSLLRAHADQARRSLELVTLRTDLDLPVPIPALRYEGPNAAALRAFLDKHAFASILNELDAAA